jgi:L,D-transpeptidase catalytic domain
VLPVLRHATSAAGAGWLQVQLPGRPNRHTGWIRQEATVPSTTSWHIVVDTSRRRATVYDYGRVVRTFVVIVGKPSTATPRGEVLVEEDIQL